MSDGPRKTATPGIEISVELLGGKQRSNEDVGCAGRKYFRAEITGRSRAANCVRVPVMPPAKTKPRRDFDAALNAYLEAIQDKKTALLAAINQPSQEEHKKYESVSRKEKEARRAYRKATKKLHALIRNS